VIDVLTVESPQEGTMTTDVKESERATASAGTAQGQKADKKASAGPQKPRGASGQDPSGKKTTSAKKGTRSPKSTRTAKAVQKRETAREGSKSGKVLELLKRPDGATLKEIMKATGWQAHSVRGFLSGTLRKKLELGLQSAKREAGERVYHLPQ
jgi:hypothetical protein